MSRETRAAIMAGVEGSNPRILRNNTVEYTAPDGARVVRLHHTDIVTFRPDGSVVLNTGGWRTSTTKERMNRYALCHVWQENRRWWVDYFGKRYPYADGITLYPDGTVTGAAEADELARRKYWDRLIARMLAKFDRCGAPIPDAGDCFGCSMVAADRTRPMGGDCVLGHLQECYLHGSLVIRAMEHCGYRPEQIALHYQMRLTDTMRRCLRRFLQHETAQGTAPIPAEQE